VADRVLDKLRDLVRSRNYVMTLHAEEEMATDGLSIFDVESTILTGRIVGRQRDRQTGEQKYLVRGRTVDDADLVEVVGKVGPTGKLVIITVYRE